MSDRVANDDFSVFLFRVLFIIEDEGKRISEYHCGFRESDMMFPHIPGRFLCIPLELYTHSPARPRWDLGRYHQKCPSICPKSATVYTCFVFDVNRISAGTGLELDAIAATVLGGTSLFGGVGGVGGAIIGALLIGVLGNGMNLLEIPSYYQQVVKGLVFVLAVLLDLATKGKPKTE